MKKKIVLGVLFILPLVAYLFFASGVHHFSKLPVLEKQIGNLEDFHKTSDTLSLKNHISIIGFMGNDLQTTKGNLFNINQKIYNYFYKFQDFQMVMVMPKGTKKEVDEVLKEFSHLTDISKWNFVYGSPVQIQKFFKSLNSPYELDTQLHTPYVFIIDKKGQLRGRDDEQTETNTLERKYGYNTSSVAEINAEMKDDVKVILAEYRLALKKYNRKNTQILDAK